LIHPLRATYFPRAGEHAGSRSEALANVRDARTGGRNFSHTERHLQALWYDPRWRPARLKTRDGEEVIVESPGNWNLEAGPDFMGASLIIGPGHRRVVGDVEIHVFPSGWKQHGHHLDPRYRQVCLHLTYFEGLVPDALLPPGAIQVALRPALQADPDFALDHIDISAYPYAGRAEEPPCRRILSAWPMEKRAAFLEAAGHARLRQKSDRVFNAIRERGVDQVLYEGIMGALGYHHNKVPMARLATVVPLDLLRHVAQGRAAAAYAVLAGVSGLLPASIDPKWDDETRAYVRSVWDMWWRSESAFPVRMARSEWRVSGIRPANHPLRRLMAVARLFSPRRSGLDLLEQWSAGEPGDFISRMAGTLPLDARDYWQTRFALGGKKSKRPVCLVGRDRWELIGLNVLIPCAAACGFAPDRVNRLLAAIPPEPENKVIRQTAFYLLGRDYPSRILMDAARVQGLQQVFHDHCLNDRSRCRSCLLPGHLSGGAGRSGSAPA